MPNAENLTLVQGTGVTIASYTYDALDRRITKTVGAKTTRYVYAGNWIIEEYVTDGAPEAKVAEYYHGSGMDDVVMARRTDVNDLDGDGSTVDLVDLYMHKNMAGSTMVVTMGNGMPVEFITYDAFGKPTFKKRGGALLAASRTEIPFLFTGREYDAETGYYPRGAACFQGPLGSLGRPVWGFSLWRSPLRRALDGSVAWAV